MRTYYPQGTYTLPLWNYSPQNHNRDGLLGPNSTMVVYIDPLGLCVLHEFLGL